MGQRFGEGRAGVGKLKMQYRWAQFLLPVSNGCRERQEGRSKEATCESQVASPVAAGKNYAGFSGYAGPPAISSE